MKPKLRAEVAPAVSPKPFHSGDWLPAAAVPRRVVRRIGFAYGLHSKRFEPVHYTITLDDSSEGWGVRILAHTPVAVAQREAAAEAGEEIPLYEAVTSPLLEKRYASAELALGAARRAIKGICHAGKLKGGKV